MPDYSKSRIYAIRSHACADVYIGSTTQALSCRMREHRADYRQFLKNGSGRASSCEIVKHDDAYIELIEEIACENKEQLLRREGEIIRATERCVNRQIPGRVEQAHT